MSPVEHTTGATQNRAKRVVRVQDTENACLGFGNGLDFKMGRSIKNKKVVHNRLLLALANGTGHQIEKFGNPNLCGGGVLTGLT
jgi:hypothetical protein